ncbi:ribonuclease HII [Sebaldella sp. S0638]|uniref:ribonuclease HII n=1 Tax=Sebaldella sp. S0638 TaxID=2957809 RepID=UPI00209DE3E9|nr:ribonuclease HII [Sebaldella sp. S0638]MCP1223830.1 ribonuclease HII [Sebaldella sp. S0638]
MNELRLFDNEYNCVIAGVDEAGRGPLAGPVVAAAVIIEDYFDELDGINDSKKLTEKKREKLYDIIREKCKVGVGIASENEIDKINILNATFLAMRRALEQVGGYDIVLVDGNHKIREYSGKQQEIIKGDGRSMSIAAASIIAKVYRDNIMKELALKYPDYRFEKHKGYGTKLHRELLLAHGACEIHRKSFLKKILGEYSE